MLNPVQWLRGSLLRRLIGPSVVLSIVAVVLVGTVAFFTVRAVLLDHTYARLESSLDLHDAELKRWISDQKQYVVFFSRTPSFRERVAAMLSYRSDHIYYREGYKALSEFLFSYIKVIHGVREVMILSDRDGRILISTHRENEGTSRAEYPFFAKGKQNIFIQGVYSWKGTEEPAISVVKPLRDANGTYAGVLAVHLDLERMAQVVFGNSELGESGETYIVDRQHRLIRAQLPGRPEFFREASSEGIRLAVEGGHGVGLYENYAGVPVAGAYRWLPELKVALLAEISQEEVFAPARQFGGVILGLGLLLSGLLFAGNVFAARWIVKPVLTLSGMASRIADGDLSVRIDVQNKDEIGVLADSFNRMVERLKELYSDLQSSVTHFSTVFQLSPNAIAVQNFTTGVFTAVNESFTKLYGFAPDEVVGRSDDELKIWKSNKARMQTAVLLRRNSSLQGVEQEFLRKDGSSFKGLISSRLIEFDGVPHAVTVFWDVSEQLRIEEELRKNQQRLQLLIDRMPIGCIAWNTGFEVVLWNPEAEKIFGFSRAEALDRHTNDLIVPADVQPQVEGIYQRLLDGDTMAHSVNDNITKDGRRITCDWYNTPLFDDSGTFIGVISMVHDISERRSAEEELERHRLYLEELVSERTRLLEEAQEELLEKERLALLGQLTATVSHELRNPLGTVSNAIFLVRDAYRKEETDKLEYALALAERNVLRCDGIISELLDFTRNHDLAWSPLDLGRWLGEFLGEQSVPDHVQLVADLPAGTVVPADAERLRRAVINVLDNAVQALGEKTVPGGRIGISLDRAEGRAGIVIADDGPGFSAEIAKRIFEPLFSTKGFGVGLGMPVVKNIVEDHGGDVTVKSTPGEGTVVTIWLPEERGEG